VFAFGLTPQLHNSSSSPAWVGLLADTYPNITAAASLRDLKKTLAAGPAAANAGNGEADGARGDSGDRGGGGEAVSPQLSKKNAVIWTPTQYDALLSNWGAQPADDDEWSSWCATGQQAAASGDDAAAAAMSASLSSGGYSCGLWLLFHTLLANTDDATALRTLEGVRAFIKVRLCFVFAFLIKLLFALS
jgi:hypothetical protein